jgi:hypothetical protein
MQDVKKVEAEERAAAAAAKQAEETFEAARKEREEEEMMIRAAGTYDEGFGHEKMCVKRPAPGAVVENLAKAPAEQPPSLSPSATHATPSVSATETDDTSSTNSSFSSSDEVCGVWAGLVHAAGSCCSQAPLG